MVLYGNLHHVKASFRSVFFFRDQKYLAREVLKNKKKISRTCVFVGYGHGHMRNVR